MKIAFLIDTVSCDTAGTQKQLLETIRRLNRDEFEPQLICLWESPWMQMNSLPCPCTVLGYRGFLKWGFPGVVRRLAGFISRQRIELMQTFFEDSIFVGLLGAALAHSRPVLISSRRDMGLGRENQPWYHALFGMALPWANRYFSGIIANSEQVREYVSQRERTAASKIKVIYNGVEIPGDDVGSVPAVFTSHSADIWIGLIGSLSPVKRHDLLLRALTTIVTEEMSPRVRVLFLGEGHERNHLERLARDLGVRHLVHFEGAVTDVNSYLRHVDIGVLCSDREGLSNAILEYMAFGMPVVATNVGGNVELVSNENGIRVPDNDAVALARALSTLIKDQGLRARMGAASLAKARRLFSWDRSMSELEGYYRSLIPSRDGTAHLQRLHANKPDGA